MGSPLGLTLANILMTAFEDEIIRLLIDEGTVKFNARYVDNILDLSSDEAQRDPINARQVQLISSTNSIHCEEFVDNDDVHFLDIKINSLGTTIYPKSTHAGQYSYYSSFTP